MRYILGVPKVEWVFGQVERKTDRYERSVRSEDCVAGFLLFEGGVQGTFQTDPKHTQHLSLIHISEPTRPY